jgi:hypothetical protein
MLWCSLLSCIENITTRDNLWHPSECPVSSARCRWSSPAISSVIAWLETKRSSHQWGCRLLAQVLEGTYWHALQVDQSNELSGSLFTCSAFWVSWKSAGLSSLPRLMSQYSRSLWIACVSSDDIRKNNSSLSARYIRYIVACATTLKMCCKVPVLVLALRITSVCVW